MSFDLFVAKWTRPSHPPRRVTADAVAAVERHFGAPLPDAYKRAVLTHGLPRIAIGLLNAISDRELDIHSLGEFHVPAEIVSLTKGCRSAGMPSDLVTFASDVGGSQHCFRMREGVLTPAIWFFDHDLVEVEPEADDFDAWIEIYCAIEPVPDDRDE